MADKYTSRKLFSDVIAANISDEATEKAKAMLEALDKQNESRKNGEKKPSKASVENAPLMDAVVAFLTETGEAKLASEVAVGMGITVQKANALLIALVKADRIVKNEPATKSKPFTYSIT